jgi:hypothetical protein
MGKRAFSMVLPLLLAACSGDSKSTCVTGATQECLRSDGSNGVQVCQADGAWGSCEAFSGNDAVAPEEDVRSAADAVAPEVQAGDGGCHPACSDKECGDDGCGGSCGQCADGFSCKEGQCVEGPCEPACGDKECGGDGCDGTCGECGGGATCVDGSCQCSFESCGEVCCGEGEACFDGACCTPDCTDKECGEDGCGGLCNGCLDIVYDDGETETAYGYSTPPQPEPTRIACMVRFDLPAAGMKLTQFTAGWMWGLYNLQVPFELAWLPGDAMDCEDGPDGVWYKEWCETTPEQLISIGSFLPLEPYEPMDSEMLGEVVFTSQTIYMVTLFDIDEYPIFVCPIDTSGDGSVAYMMPQYEKTQGVVLDGPSFDKTDENIGVVPFRIRVQEAG